MVKRNQPPHRPRVEERLARCVQCQRSLSRTDKYVINMLDDFTCLACYESLDAT